MSKSKIAQLRQYFSAPLPLIKLHAWDSKTKRGEKEIELGKAPVHKDWPGREYSEESINEWMQDGNNVGVKLGDGWAVIDIDPRNGGLESLNILKEDYNFNFEKYAYVMTGREDGGRHIYVRVPKGWRGRSKIKSLPGVDFKHHKGMQVVSAGSRHPNGGYYAWAKCVPLQATARIPQLLLDDFSVKEPPEGMRGSGNESFGSIEPESFIECFEHLEPQDFKDHDDWLTLMMSVHWLSGGQARQEFIEWSTSDPEYFDRGEAIGYRWDSLSGDEGFSKRVVKGGFLYKILNEKGLAQYAPKAPLSKDFEDISDEEIQIDQTDIMSPEMKVLDFMNKNHAVVNLQGRAFFLQHITDYDSYGYEVEKLIFSQGRDMREFYRSKHIVFLDKKASGDAQYRKTNWFDFWSEHPNRRQFSSVIFDPDREKEFETFGGKHILNLWEGFKFSASTRPNGSWDKLKELIWAGISDRDEAVYEYVLNWVAYSYQNPGVAQRTALVLKGPRGAGKGTLARAWLAPFGIHGMATEDGDDLFGKYNSAVGYKCGLFLDEAFWAGDKAKLGKLKARLTEPTFRIGEKYEPTRTVRNFLKIMIASNEDHVIPAAADDRRFTVLEVTPAFKNNKKFFKELNKELSEGGKQAFFYDMINRDIGGFDPEFDRVVTDALRYQVRATHGEIADWWIAMLQSGHLPDQIGDWSHSSVFVPKASLRNHFDRYLGTRRGEWGYNFEKTFRSKFKELLPEQILESDRVRISPDDDQYAGVELDSKSRCYVYKLPKLSECRGRSADMFGKYLFDFADERPQEKYTMDDLI